MQHDRVVPDQAATRHYPPDVRSVRDARQHAQERLAGTPDVTPDVAARVAMIVSELAGNAVLHAATSYSVSIGRHGGAVRGEVVDGNRHTPAEHRTREPADEQAQRGHGGRGLMIVEAVADRWGVLREGDGKIVWFEIDVSPRRDSPGAHDVGSGGGLGGGGLGGGLAG